jgi:hypothetical protein
LSYREPIAFPENPLTGRSTSPQVFLIYIPVHGQEESEKNKIKIF